MDEIEVIQREIKFNVGENSFTAKFPNVGQMIDIESLKQALTSNRYGIMSASGIKSTYMVLDLVDAVVFFQICAPAVGKYFNIENYANMQIDEVRDITHAYLKIIKPWYENLLTKLYSVNENGSNQ